MSELADKMALECRYHVLSDCVTLKSGSFKKFLDELRTLEAELARLRKAIEDAPHAKTCSSMRMTSDAWHGPCDCWKSKALKDGK